MRKKGKLQLCRGVRFSGGREQREVPVLVLHETGKRQVMLEHELRAHAEIVEVPAFEKIAIDFLISVAKLHPGAGAQPVGQPTLSATTGAPHPTGEQVAVVGVTVAKAAQVEVDEAGHELTGVRRAD